MESTVLITGASGLLGANLVRYMHQLGYKIRVLVRPGAHLTVLADIPMEIIHGYIDRKECVEEAMQGCDYVVHAASLTTQWGTPYEEYKKINIHATQLIAQACIAYGVKRLIYISTANTLAPGSKASPGTELNAFGLHHINSGYINSKYVALQYIQEQVQQNGLPAIIVSPTFMIGRYDVKPSSGQMVLHGIKKGIMAYPSGGKNFVHVEDVCAGIVKAIEKGTIGEHYLLAGHNLSYKEFFRLTDFHAGSRRRKVQIPGSLLRGLGRLGSLVQSLSGKSVKLNYASAYMLSLDNYYSGKKAERELGIEYKSIELAVADAVAWFRETKYC
ncbi:MAG: NAD-dependent epimerase/dehydratase family protein [Taibaiella sp.]|nr:NAD-dependent epimerase/dehydratase family protein [Taibaiella sp.]